jgi:hypothetical protein
MWRGLACSMPPASAVAGAVQKTAYSDPLVASTLVGTARPAFPEQLVEIKFVGKI